MFFGFSLFVPGSFRLLCLMVLLFLLLFFLILSLCLFLLGTEFQFIYRIFRNLFLIILLLRFLIRGIPFADGIRNWYAWLLAVSGGIGTAYSSWKKDQEKK